MIIDEITAGKGRFTITYDEKKNDVKARVEYNSKKDGNKKLTYSCDGINNVNNALREFLTINIMSLKELVDNGIVKFSNKETSLRYEFDFYNNLLVGRRLGRVERRALEGRTIEKDTVYHESDTVDSITESIDRNLIIDAVIKLNPTVEIQVIKDATGAITHILSSVPGEDLKLPGSFYYNEKNGITNKHKTISGSYVTIDVRPLVKEKFDIEEPKEETVVDFLNSKDFDAVVKAIIKLNPDVEIKVEKEGVENRRIFASVPGDKLKLPNGLFYNSTYGIISKYLTIKVEDLEKAKDGAVEEVKEKKEEPEVEVVEKVEKDKKEKTSIKEKFEKEKTSIKEKVKNLKFVNWKTLKVILATGLVVWGIAALTSHKGNSNSNNTSKSSDNHNNDDNYSTYDDGRVATTYNTTDEDAYRYSESVYEQAPVYDTEDRVYNEVNNDTYGTTYIDNNYLSGNIDDQMNEIAGICYQNISDIYNFLYSNQGHLDESANFCDFTSIVPNGDRDAIAIINNSRNYVINNAYTDHNTILTKSDVYSFLLDYVNYVFEGGTVFDRQPIKAYNYLDTYSKYIVNVVGETMLQLYPEFNYESSYSKYSYEDLIDMVSNNHNNLANELSNGYGRGY